VRHFRSSKKDVTVLKIEFYQSCLVLRLFCLLSLHILTLRYVQVFLPLVIQNAVCLQARIQGLDFLFVCQLPLKRIFGPNWDHVARGWRRLHNEELLNLHASSNIIRVIKSRKM